MNGLRQWLYHLISAAISGAANGMMASFIDPSKFNIGSVEGWAHIGELAVLGAIVPVLTILKNGLPGAALVTSNEPSSKVSSDDTNKGETNG